MYRKLEKGRTVEVRGGEQDGLAFEDKQRHADNSLKEVVSLFTFSFLL